MNEMAGVERAGDWRRLKAPELDIVSSPITKCVYNLGLDELFAWHELDPRFGFTKITLSAWCVGLGSVRLNVRITTVRTLAVSAHLPSESRREQAPHFANLSLRSNSNARVPAP
jgi:hypothetical protein